MQTIDLCDEVVVNRAPDLLARAKPPSDPPAGSLVITVSPHEFYYEGDETDPFEGVHGESVTRATQLLDPEWQRDVRATLKKRIPIAAGLAGGSSDAAATLRVLDRLWGLQAELPRLEKLGAQIGSDVPFFLWGGTALVEGRGERVTPLPNAPMSWLVILVPPIKLQGKTKRMYEAIGEVDYSDGGKTDSLAEKLRKDGIVHDQDICNAFERVAVTVFEGLEQYRDALLSAGSKGVYLAGAGPALFAVADSEASARELAERVQAPEAKVFVARTLAAAEATAIVD
jgi:4-diphosphocytidyl-2-C-methyl-D-erythritol kinase